MMQTIELFTHLRQVHHNAPKMRCGARRTMTVEHYNGKPRERDLVCTNDVGHEGLHKDALCCWKFHSFDDAEPQPEDVWRGENCACGHYQCKTRRLLDLAGIPELETA